jgi:hypothetical protein
VKERTDDLKAQAAVAVEALLGALQRRDAPAYHGQLCAEDRAFMSLEQLRENLQAMTAALGDLTGFHVEGVSLHESASLAAVQVQLHFSNAGVKFELYQVVQENGAWRMHFDFAEMA